jgi:hypothetical protein
MMRSHGATALMTGAVLSSVAVIATTSADAPAAEATSATLMADVLAEIAQIMPLD